MFWDGGAVDSAKSSLPRGVRLGACSPGNFEILHYSRRRILRTLVRFLSACVSLPDAKKDRRLACLLAISALFR